MVLTIDDPDAAFKRAVDAGATIVHPMTNEYGWRLCRVVHPFGHHWEIGKPSADLHISKPGLKAQIVKTCQVFSD